MSILRNSFIFSVLLSACLPEGDTPDKMAPKGDNIKPFAVENDFKISKTMEKPFRIIEILGRDFPVMKFRAYTGTILS